MINPNDTQDLLRALNLQIFGINPRMTLEYVAIADLREQDVNANAMPVEMFNALVGNLKRAGHPETVPLIANREGSDVLEVVSGHHRIRGMRRAGQTHCLAFRYHDLTESEIRAKQLAHNSIAGESDPQIVKELFGSIGALELRVESFIDPASLAELPKPVPFKAVDADLLLTSKTVTVVFLSTQAEDFAKALELLHPAGREDTVYLASLDTFEGFKKAVHQTRKYLNIKSMPMAIAAMAELALRQIEQESNNP